MARITINGKTFDVNGDNVTITSSGGTISVNGSCLATGLTGTVNLKVDGAVARVEADGSVECGDVTGDVNAGGSVTCRDVGGTANAGGSIRAVGHLRGPISAGGSVRIG